MLLITPKTTLNRELQPPIDENVTSLEINYLLPGEKICLDLNQIYSLVILKQPQQERDIDKLNIVASAILKAYGFDEYLIYDNAILLAYQEMSDNFDISIFVEV